MECLDFMEFQDSMKKMRALDDKIIYSLNASLPTESFSRSVNAEGVCKDIYSQIQIAHSQREDSIKRCIVKSADSVKSLREQKAEKPNDFDVSKNLRAEQTKLRLLQTELSVEEVIREKTKKLIAEKCRTFYKPNDVL